MRTAMIVLIFVAIALSCGAAAAPSAPSGLNADFVENGTKISWQHSGGDGVSFNVYRGDSVETGKVIATVTENFFFDRTASITKRHVYFVTAIDASGESKAAGSIVVEPTEPFSVRQIKPEKNTLDLKTGQKIDFVIAIESDDFSKLQDLEAVLVNGDFGTREDFAYDLQSRMFSVSIMPPEKQPGDAILTTYKAIITATVGGSQVSQSLDIVITLIPKNDPNLVIAVQNILLGTFVGPVILALFVAGTLVFVGWRWSLYRRAGRDRWFGELFAARRSRALLKNDLANGKRTQEQFNEEDYILQGKINEAEVKLGFTKKGSLAVRPNPLEGCSPAEIEEIRVLAEMMKTKKKEMAEEEMRLQLVKNNRGEKIAKKVAQMVYEK